MAMTRQDPQTLEEAVANLATDLKDLAGTVAAAELLRSVRKGQPGDVARWGAQCSCALLNSRTVPHCAGSPFALCAPPLWLAVYRKDYACAEALLHAAPEDAKAREELLEANATVCPGDGYGRNCSVGGMSPLHLAVSRGSSECVAKLLSLRVDADARLCFVVDEADEPEWDEACGAFSKGLEGLCALQLAALRSDDRMCSLLLAHGANASALGRLSSAAAASLPAELSKKLAPITGDDGEALECAICYEPLLRLTSEWTPCCLHCLHAHCLARLTACPMCRSPLGRGEAATSEAALASSRAPQGDRELAAALRESWFEGGSASSHPGPGEYRGAV
jgi:hypothetical protein